MNDLWSHVFRWDAQLAGSAAQRPKDDFQAQYNEVSGEAKEQLVARRREEQALCRLILQ